MNLIQYVLIGAVGGVVMGLIVTGIVLFFKSASGINKNLERLNANRLIATSRICLQTAARKSFQKGQEELRLQ